MAWLNASHNALSFIILFWKLIGSTMCNENVTDEHTGFLLSNHDRFGVRDYNGLPPICLKLTVTTKFEICAYPRRSLWCPRFYSYFVHGFFLPASTHMQPNDHTRIYSHDHPPIFARTTVKCSFLAVQKKSDKQSKRKRTKTRTKPWFTLRFYKREVEYCNRLPRKTLPSHITRQKYMGSGERLIY